MSWFDKLFGEDNDSNEDILRNKIKRRQANQSNDTNHDSLLPQNNDIYHRPKGKFRFPMEGFESGNAESENTTTQDVYQSNVNHDIEEFRTQDNKRHRRRRNHANDDGIADSSYQSKGYQSRKKKIPTLILRHQHTVKFLLHHLGVQVRIIIKHHPIRNLE